MSANNIVFINEDNYKVYYQGCVDNKGLGELIGKGKTLKEAVKIAKKWIRELEGYLEYGVTFIGKDK